jgi:hypothetical protein
MSSNRVSLRILLKPETKRHLEDCAEREGKTVQAFLDRVLDVCCPGYACPWCGGHGITTEPDPDGKNIRTQMYVYRSFLQELAELRHRRSELHDSGLVHAEVIRITDAALGAPDECED